MSETLEQRIRREAHSDALHKLNAYTGDVVELLDERDAIISGLRQEVETKRAEVYAQAAEIERLRDCLNVAGAKLLQATRICQEQGWTQTAKSFRERTDLWGEALKPQESK